MRATGAVALAALVGAGAGVGGYALAGNGARTTATTTTVVSQRAASTAQNASAVTSIYKNAAAGVVEIAATSSGGQLGPFGESQQQSGVGSGFVYDAKGHVVTNFHVVAGATSVRVTFSDGTERTAAVVGTDASTDLAVLKVDAPASLLKPVALASSSSVQVGQGVVAIGSPFGLEGTITTGIVSATGRQITAPNGYTISGAIQTDAAINHGNSGGPLLNASGKVIGVNAQIESDSGGNDGVGFAIPSDTVRSVVSQILSGGQVRHAYLGVQIQTGSDGVSIARVVSGSPAAGAGLRVGDRIRAVGGTPVTTAAELQAAIAGRKPGDTVTLSLDRGGEHRSIRVRLGSQPS